MEIQKRDVLTAEVLIEDVSQRRPEWIGSARPNACPTWISHKLHNQRFGIRCVRAVAHLLQGVRVVTGSQQEYEVFARSSTRQPQRC